MRNAQKKFQNGPKKLNRNREESEGDADIHKKKVQLSQFPKKEMQMSQFSKEKVQIVPIFQKKVQIVPIFEQTLFNQVRSSFSGWQIFELERVFEARRYVRSIYDTGCFYTLGLP